MYIQMEKNIYKYKYKKMMNLNEFYVLIHKWQLQNEPTFR